MIDALLCHLRTTGFILLSQFEAVFTSPVSTPDEQAQKDASLKMLLPLIEKNHDEQYLIRLLLSYSAQDLLAVYLSSAKPALKAYALLQFIQSTQRWPSGFYHAVIASGAHINDELATIGLTPLQLAARLGNVELFRLLLLDGADLYMKNSSGLNAYDEVLASGNAELLIFMINYEKVEKTNLSSNR
ncbi:ankyrin repeat domain-containing protein [Pantoea agglomerans]|uniref:ankyrin repeat domain-containing protein n=1 Tax=Enterobacter agglomerans TaxID=549 RepID=UPI003C7DEA5B